MQQSPIRYIFVYGTLRRGEDRDINLLSPPPQTLGFGVVQGILYDLGSYPGLLLVDQGYSDVVHGEVYSICPELEQLLDQIEEVWPQQSGEYIKREVLVRMVGDTYVLEPAQTVGGLTCLVYAVASLHALGKSVITSGDWVHHRKHKPF